MALCKHFYLASGQSSCHSHRHRLLATFSCRNFYSSIHLARPILHPRRHPSFARPQSLTIEREESGFLVENLGKSKTSLLAERNGKSNSREDASILDVDDDIEDEDVSDDESEDDIDYSIEDLVELEDLVSEDEDEDDGSESLGIGDPLLVDVKEELRKRVQDLCKRVQWEEDYRITARDLAAMYNFRIDKFQRLAIEGFLKGSSVVVCAPTSSGKTLIAECAAAATLAMQRRLFYTTPLKALSNQKLREFRDMFGEENVGLITGDAAVNRDAPILIMTTEILRNMLYQSIGTLEERDQLHNVCAIVLDEVHYLSDISRGTVWEEVVIYCPKEVQLICLSATVANSDELASWIAQVHGPTELVTSRRRPVPLTWHFSTRYSLSPLLSEGGTEMNRRLALAGFHPDDADNGTAEVGKRHSSSATSSVGRKSAGSKSKRGKKDEVSEPRALSNEELQFLRRRQIPRVEETLKQLKYRGMLPAIWFIFSRKGCDTAVRYVEDLQLLSDEEQRQVYESITTFRKEHPDAVRESSVSSLLCGFASHHAGCLPLWKSFVEELFQKGLIKVVFATETLAAGINMPARTTVLSSLSKRGDSGHALLSSNAMLQMAGRAGRRGLDEEGHVVLVQTPFEGAEEGCKILFAGPDPLVSQFTASYGMVLNLLSSMKSPDGKVLRQGRTLEEARALIEQSFGNYVGNDVKIKATKEISKLEARIAQLQGEEIPDVRSLLTNEEVDEYMSLKQNLKVEKGIMRELRAQYERKRLDLVQPLLQEAFSNQDHLPYIQIFYFNARTGSEMKVSAVCISVLPESSFFNQEALLDSRVTEDLEEVDPIPESNLTERKYTQPCQDVPYFVALGSDNCWYAFSATSVHSIWKVGLRNANISTEDGSVGDFLTQMMPEQLDSWQIVGKSGKSGFTNVWSLKGSYHTLPWSRSVLVENDLSEQLQFPEEIAEAVNAYSKQRRKVVKIKKEMKSTKASNEYWQVVAMTRLRDANIAKLDKKRSKLVARVNRMQPTGWHEFLQVVNVLEQAKAISSQTHEMLSLGKIAACIRGVNELWLALALSEKCLLPLNAAQLASVCGSLVTEGVKIRSSETGMGGIYQPSSTIQEAVAVLREKQRWLLELQNECGVVIPCDLDDQLAGLVEAWASGVTWKELMMDCNLDEGDLARLLRRTIDLLAQVPLLPSIDTDLRKTATSAADLMDRSPISELIA